MSIAQVTGSTPAEVSGAITLADGTQVSLQSVLIWTEEERNAAGLYTVPPIEVPEGQRLASSSLVYKKGEGVSLAPVYEPKDKRQDAARELGSLRNQFIDSQLTGAALPEGFDAYAEAVAEIAKADEPYTDPLPEKPASRA